MFKKVSSGEIQDIIDRLGMESKELKNRNLSFQRKGERGEEIRSLIYYLITWLEWQKYRKRDYHQRIERNKAKENNQSIDKEKEKR